MKICDDLRQAVLQAAIQGKLTTQRQEDGDARDLLKQIAAEKAQLFKEGKIKKEKPLPEITEDEKPFDIPDNWTFVKLFNIAKKITDGEHKTPSRITFFNGIYLLSARNIKDGYIDLKDVDYVDVDEFDRISKRCNPKFGDVLISCSGSVGRCAVVSDDNNYVMVRSAAMLSPICVDSMYIMYCIQSPMVQHQVKIKSKQTAQANLFQDAIKNIIIPLPPLLEQKRIVAKVDKLMAEIDELEKVEKELVAMKNAFPGDMKAALLQAAMQGKLTTQRKEDGDAKDLLQLIAAEKAKIIKEGKLKKEKPLAEITEDEKPFDIPDNWEWVRLNDLVIKNIKRGKSPTYSDDGYAFVFAQKCNVKTGGINLKLALKLKDEKLSKYPIEEYMLDADIVVNSTGTGTMGRVGIFRDADRINEAPIVPDSHVTIIRTNNLVTAIYLSYFLKSKSEYLEDSGDGSTNQKELKPFTIMNLVVPLPPLAEQKRLVTKLDKLLPLCDSLVES